MRIFLLIFILFFSFTVNSNSQVNKQWTSFYNGTGNDTDIVTAFAVDNSGNVYVTGFSIGSGTGKDFATIKYNTSGVQLWAARYNNDVVNEDDIANAIAFDGAGNVYVTGGSTGSETFQDYVTIKYSPDGAQLWLKRFNGTGNDDDIANAIAIDGTGNAYVTGYSVGTNSSEDYTTIKYSPEGNELWIAIYNNELAFDIDIATSIALDPEGNVYVTGYSTGKTSSEDYATVKYNTDGVELWVSRYNGTGNGYDITSAISVDASGNVFVTGFSLGTDSTEDYATLKYNPIGQQLWAARYNGPSNGYDISTSLAVDNSGNTFVTGYSFDTNSAEDYLTIKYNQNGEQQWASRYDGGEGNYDIATSIKVDNSGNSYVTGYEYNNGSEEDYATIKYNSSGEQQWAEIYNDNSNGGDIAASLALDEQGNIYVCGYSYEGPNNIDYVTIKYSPSVGITQISNNTPDKFKLNQNYPNPFNPKTNFEFRIANVEFVSIEVYNILGSKVSTIVNEKLSAGIYKVEFDGTNYPSGIYFYKLQAGAFVETKRMTLIK